MTTATAALEASLSVFWRPSAALQVAHRPTRTRALAAVVLAAICAFVVILTLAGPASASTVPDSESGVAAQTGPAQALVGFEGSETPAVVGGNSVFGYDGSLGCCVAPSGVPSAEDEARRYAQELLSGSGSTPRVATAAVDTRAGDVYFGTSGEYSVRPADLQDALPSSSAEPYWSVENCGEISACASAVANGANLEDLEVFSIQLPELTVRGPCHNCEQWVPGP